MKIKLTLSFTVLLVIGMLLTNLVVIILWKSDLIDRQVERAHRVTEQVNEHIYPAYPAPDETNFLEQLFQIYFPSDAFGGIIVDLGERQISTHPFPLSQTLSQLLRNDRYSDTEIIRSRSGDLPPEVPLVFNQTLYISVPLIKQNDVIGHLGTAISLAPVYQKLWRAEKTILAYLALNGILLCILAFFRILKIAIRPLERMANMADNLETESDWNLLFPRQSDELGRLNASLNKMLNRIQADKSKLHETVRSLEQTNRQLAETGQKLLRTEKLATAGRLATGLAHEIGNPLGIINGYVEMLGKRDLNPEEQAEFSRRATTEINRISRLLRQLSDITRNSRGNPQKVSVHKIIHDSVALVADQPGFRDTTIATHLNSGADEVNADPDQLKQILLNCLLNSSDAIKSSPGEPQGKITISTDYVILDDSEQISDRYLQISIEDNGTGIAKDIADSVFDPFVTSKEPGKGTGLGLSVSLAIIEGMGGNMEIFNKQDRGAKVLIELPLLNIEHE